MVTIGGGEAWNLRYRVLLHTHSCNLWTNSVVTGWRRALGVVWWFDLQV